MEKTTLLCSEQAQEAALVTPEKEQVAKAPGWNPKPPEKRAHWGQARETPGWSKKKRVEEEAVERRKGWADGYRLGHEEALIGAIHKFYKDPERKARIVHIFRGNKPIVQVRSLGLPVECKIIFTNELHETQLNSKRTRKNWCKRHAAYKRRALAESNTRLFGLPWSTVEYKADNPSA